MICSPTGRPSSGASPIGRLSPGTPARFAGIVVRSFRYIASGSSMRSPIRNAVVGAAGLTSTSAFSKAEAKSRWISVRTLWALP